MIKLYCNSSCRKNVIYSLIPLLMGSTLVSACSGGAQVPVDTSTSRDTSTSSAAYLLNLIGPSTVYSGVCSVFFVTLSDVSTQTYKAASSNITLNLSSTLGGFFTTDSTCSQAAGTITIPSGLGLGFIYYKYSTTGSTTLTLSDPLSSLASVSKSIQIDSPGTSGALDTSFNSTGKLTTAIGSFGDFAVALAIQPDGKIIAAGNSHNGSNSDFALVRYNSDGSLDTSFDTDGKLITAIGSSDDFANALAIQPDGKIIAAGSSSNGSNYDFALIRLWP